VAATPDTVMAGGGVTGGFSSPSLLPHPANTNNAVLASASTNARDLLGM